MTNGERIRLIRELVEDVLINTKIPRLSDSRVKRGRNKTCPKCLNSDVRGMPSLAVNLHYRSFKCAKCGKIWTSGRRKKHR